MAQILSEIKNQLKTWNKYSSGICVYKEKISLKEKFSLNYFLANDQEVKANLYEIKKILNSGQVALIIPMKEKETTVKKILKYALEILPPNSIFIINDQSEKDVVEVTKNYEGIYLIEKDEILEAIRWEKLLPILGLSEIPRGKGMCVLAGYLFYYFLLRNNRDKKKWIFQTDADIKNPEVFKPLEYLTLGLLKKPDALQIKIAKSGRNNENNMAVRSALIILEDIAKVIPTKEAQELAKRARNLFENLAKYKWILGGTFALPACIAFARPFATGYLEETLICAFVEDKCEKEKKFSVQISNPNPCLDAENSFKKENLILQITANFINTLFLIRKPVSDWKIEDIVWLNKNLMSKSKPISLIPPLGDDGPVIVEDIPQERILPSVEWMVENKIVDFKKLKTIESSLKNQKGGKHR